MNIYAEQWIHNTHLSILKNELTDLLVYFVPKLFHIHRVLGTNDVLKERVRAKGTVKELVVTVVARVERFAALGIKISEGKVKLPVMILCRVVIRKYSHRALRLGS